MDFARMMREEKKRLAQERALKKNSKNQVQQIEEKTKAIKECKVGTKKEKVSWSFHISHISFTMDLN